MFAFERFVVQPRREPASDVATAGDGREVMEFGEQVPAGETLQNAQGKCRAADSAAGQAKSALAFGMHGGDNSPHGLGIKVGHPLKSLLIKLRVGFRAKLFQIIAICFEQAVVILRRFAMNGPEFLREHFVLVEGGIRERISFHGFGVALMYCRTGREWEWKLRMQVSRLSPW